MTRVQHPSVVLAVLLFAGATFALSQTLVVTALPTLAAHYDASPTATAWILTAFLLSGAIAIPIVGRLGDVHGKRRVLTAVMLVFGAGAAINTVADSLAVVIAGRALQGIAGGLFPLAFGIIRDSFPPKRIAGALGIMSAIYGIGAGIGLPLSGLVVDHLSVPWLYAIGLLAVPAAIATSRLIPPSPPGPRVPTDWLGAALLATSIGGVLLAITQGNRWGWTSPATVAVIAAGGIAGVAFVGYAFRARHPLVDLRLLGQRPVAIANITIFLVGASMFISFVLNPLLAQTDPEVGFGFGTSPTTAGLLLLSTAVSQLVAGPLAGRLGGRIGFRPLLMAGTLLMSASGVWMVVLHDHPWDLVAGGGILGTGIACASAAAANIVVGAVPRSQVGAATGMNTMLRTAGGAFGAAIATACLAGQAAPPAGAASERAYVIGFAIATAIGAVAFASACLLPTQREVSRAPASPRRG